MTDYPQSFLWRGLFFQREEREGVELLYRSGRWIVWRDSRELEREDPWWGAAWQATQQETPLAPRGHSDTYEKALELCLGRLRKHARDHAVKMEDLQRALARMNEEKDALVRDLLLFVVPEE